MAGRPVRAGSQIGAICSCGRAVAACAVAGCLHRAADASVRRALTARRDSRADARARPRHPARIAAGRHRRGCAALWDRGDHRAALALLYRGLLSRLVHVHRVPIRDSSTEGDCLALAARCLTPRRQATPRASSACGSASCTAARASSRRPSTRSATTSRRRSITCRRAAVWPKSATCHLARRRGRCSSRSAIWIATHTYWADATVPMPLKGEARHEPVLRGAAAHVEALGATARSAIARSSCRQRTASSCCRLALEPRARSSQAIERWVESGGRLVVGQLARDDECRTSSTGPGSIAQIDDRSRSETRRRDSTSACRTFTEDDSGHGHAAASRRTKLSAVRRSALLVVRRRRSAVEWALRDDHGHPGRARARRSRQRHA